MKQYGTSYNVYYVALDMDNVLSVLVHPLQFSIVKLLYKNACHSHALYIS
ncbi:hypothetical protein [Leptospira paudalimensis]|uniref:Toxin-antitoxin system, toxin component n=1 Tax=Leptospira paudalimensis TaxID=2950024 RepID=A0ABT3MCL8_9LEPT|nr:hypothetical protein [Leptospira paudalimensis]MCW7506135.1 hypothetical protein [Leptospira paudalimensis]